MMKIAVAGLGFMGTMHLKAYKDIESAEMAAVCDLDEKRLSGDMSEVQGNIGGPGERLDFSKVARHSSLEALAADGSVEAVDICLPTNLHCDWTVRLLESGKHVLVEKPMALSIEECRTMMDAARSAGRQLMVAQVIRFWPDYAVARQLVQSGALGPVRSVYLERKCAAPAWGGWLTDASKSGGGVLDLLVHDINYLQYLLGLPEGVAARGTLDAERKIDTIWANFHYPGVDFAVVSGGWYHLKSYPFSMSFTIVCEEGTLDFHSAAERPLTVHRLDGSEEKPELPEGDGYRHEIEYFLECVRQNNAPEACPPQESADSIRLAQAMLSSRERGGERVGIG